MYGSVLTCARFLLLVMAVFAQPPAASSSALNCTQLTAAGNTYDLHSLPSPVVVLSEQHSAAGSSSKAEQLRLELSLCSPLPYELEHEARGPCPKGTWACLRITDITGGTFGRSNNVPVAGHGEETVTWSAELGEATSGTDIRPLNLTLQGSKYAEVTQSTQIELICDKILPSDSGPTIVSYDSDTGLLRLRWASPKACPTQSSMPHSGKDSEKQEHNQKDESGGWGLFSWLFIFILAGTVLWLGMGMFRNWNDNGQISLPSSDTLREVPFLARDLARHIGKTFSAVSGRVGSGGYEPV